MPPRRRIVLRKDSPRFQAALRRAARFKKERDLKEAIEEQKRRNKLKILFGKDPQPDVIGLPRPFRRRRKK